MPAEPTLVQTGFNGLTLEASIIQPSGPQRVGFKGLSLEASILQPIRPQKVSFNGLNIERTVLEFVQRVYAFKGISVEFVNLYGPRTLQKSQPH